MMDKMDKEIIKDESSFEIRKENFAKEFVELTKKYQIEIYAANVLLPNYEVMPQIKFLDTKVELINDNTTK
jgi:hypothetical protein